MPGTTALLWGATAGISGVLGLAVFYGAMARGMMSLVAPVSALVAAAVPAAAGVLRGDALGPPQLVGMVLALVAVAVISRPLGNEPGPARPGRMDGTAPRNDAWVLPMAIAAGLGFAGFFLAIDQAHVAGGAQWWPVTAARLGGSLVVLAVVIATRTRPSAPWRVAPLLLATSVGDLGGTLFFSLAILAGPLSLGAVVSSLYPVTTVLLAWLLLRERLGRAHLLGVVLALAGVLLISV